MRMGNSKQTPQIISALKQLSNLETELRSLGVLRSRKLLGDLGEWYASILFGFERAPDLSQKGYDCICSKTGARIQVKTDRKGNGQAAVVWMPEYNPNMEIQPFDELLIFWLAEDYRIKKCFRVSAKQLTTNNFTKMKSGKLNLTGTQLDKLGLAVSRDSVLNSDLATVVFAE